MKRTFKPILALGALSTLLILSLLRLLGGQPTLKIDPPQPPPRADQLTLKLQVQSSSNGVAYVIQASTNLIHWKPVLTVKPPAGDSVSVSSLPATNAMSFFRLVEYLSVTDTNPPVWTNGTSDGFTVQLPSAVVARWKPATDDLGVSEYRLYLNGVWLTNVPGTTLEHQFTVDLHQRSDLRIQAVDASGNATDILSLVYLPGDQLAAVSDDGGRIYILAIQADGTFGAANQVANFGVLDRGVGLGDFDRDGVLDLCAGYADGDILHPYFLKGQGDGTFAPPVALPPATGANRYMMGAAVADFNCDGNLDFVVTGYERYVFFYWGQGDGTFHLEVKDWGRYGIGLTTGDYNEDGRPDLVRTTHSDGAVRLFLSNGDGTFTETNRLGTAGGGEPYGPVTGDFDEDGHLDVITSSDEKGDITFFKGFGDSTFTNLGVNGVRTNLDVNDYGAFATADYNSDGHLDLLLATYNNRAVFFWAGNGDGTFSTNRLTLATLANRTLGICSPPLPPRTEVEITPLDPVIHLNQMLTFQALGAGVVATDFFRWTFGDQGTNPLAWTFTTNLANLGPSVTHTFTNEGRFVTRLWHTDANRIESVRGTWVTVQAQPPVAHPGGPYVYGEQTATQAVWTAQLDASASTDDFGIVSYLWTFGDGQSLTNGPLVSHNYTHIGPWPIGLLVTDSSSLNHSNATTVTFTPGDPPVAVIDGDAVVDESSAKNGVWTTRFYATNSTDDFKIWKYDWTFGDGKTGSGQTAQTTYNAVGDYLVQLTVTDHAGQTNSTNFAVSIQANTKPIPLISGPRLLSEEVATNGLWYGVWDALASTDDYGIYRWEWNFGDGATASGSTVNHSYKAAGVYPLTLTVYDFGNQTASVTQNVIVIGGEPPVARINASNLTPEGAQPVTLSGSPSTDDYGIMSYRWLLPPQQFHFTGQYLDAGQWCAANATQDDEIFASGNGNWGRAGFCSVNTIVRRGATFEGRVDTPTGESYMMVGFKNLNLDWQYDNLVYGIYFRNGDVRIYEYGNNRGSVTNYSRGNSYDFRIETKPEAGARYYLRPSGTGDPFVKIYESSNYIDASFRIAADVNQGVFGFDDFAVDQVYFSTRDVTTPVFPGGVVALEVVDHALQTNVTAITISPVTNAPPVAVINGPTNGQAGVELAFNAYFSSDDRAVKSYTWDFGDSTPPVFGPAITHRYSVAGTYTNTLTVTDYANQVATVSLVVEVTPGNALVCVPWRILNGIELPHETYSGKLIRLKAVARGVNAPFTSIWDFGDGSGSVTNEITNAAAIFNLEASHSYVGSDGTPIYATVKVFLTNGTILSDTYPIVIRPKTTSTEMNVAIDEGLWYLHKNQSRYDIDANNQGGYWTTGGYHICATASAVHAFGINGHLLTDDGSQDPYIDTVQRGINYLLTTLTTYSIGPQKYGDPDGNHNGLALSANNNRAIYETGPLMDAFVAVGRPELVAGVGGANVKGRTFRDLMQDLVDIYCWGQDEYDGGGAWRYSWNDWPDNSASQWGAIGLLAAERYWGIAAPDWVKQRNVNWVITSKGSTGFGYDGRGNGEATTPSAMVQLAYDGITTTNALWLHGENYLANNWNSLMNNNNLYAQYALTKALRAAHPEAVQKLSATGKDWFLDPQNGLARVTIDRQRADGSWLSSQHVNEQVSTAWSVIILSGSLFQRGPVAVVNLKPNPAAVGYPVVFDARGSYHQHPAYRIVDYRWIFDSSKGLDFEHPDATGPVVTNSYGSLSTNLVSLQVRDNATPALIDTASIEVRVTIPPYPPTADAGGPYVAAVDQDVHLDGGGSFDVDEASGDFLQAYDWEIDFEMPLDYNDGVAGKNAVITNGFATAGQHRVGLRVRDATSIVFPSLGLPDLTSEDFTIVHVYDRVITDLVGRPKANKIQLTWTKAGDYAVVTRSIHGPNRGFEEIGRTDSSYATFLDENVELNVEYYYRLYAYQNGRAEPLGISDAEYVISRQRTFEYHAPYFDSTPERLAKVGELYEAWLNAKNPDNEPIVYNLLLGPTNMTVNSSNGLVQFLPTLEQVGSHPVSFEVTNNWGRDVLSYTLFVFPATNNPPLANANGPYAALTGQEIQFSSAGTTDPDGNPLYYYWNFGDGVVSTNPNPAHVYNGAGDYLVTLFVNDGYGGTSSSKTHAQVTVPNRPPVAVIAQGPNFAVRLGEILSLDASASYDLDGDPLTFTWVWGDGEQNTGTATTATHPYQATGNYAGTLTVADPRDGEGVYPFNVAVQPANQPPQIVVTVSSPTPYVMSTVTFDATATMDPENDPLQFEWDFGDRTKTTGSLVTHVFKEINQFTVTLTVTDNHGGSSSTTIPLEALNAPPVFTSNPPLLGRAGTNYLYTPTISDVDGDTSTFELVQGPTAMTCDPLTGTLSWLPGTNDVGPNPINLRANDAHGASTDQTFTLVITTPVGLEVDLQPTQLVMSNVVVDSQTLALSGVARVYLRNNGADTVPVPYTVSVFIDQNLDGCYSNDLDQVVGWANLPADLPQGWQAYVDLTVHGQALFKDNPLYAFVDSERVVPEYDENNNIHRAGADANTNQPPVIDLSASWLRIDRSGLPNAAVLTARLGNCGLVSVPTNVPLAFYDGDPQNNGALIGVARSTVVLAPGQFQDLDVAWPSPLIANHTVYVVADDSGTGQELYAEISETNNRFQAEADLTANEPPVAEAGPAQTVYAGDTVVLNGRNSSDPEKKTLTYRWSILSIPIGSQAQLNAANTVQPWFLADVTGQYTVQLVVNDGLQDSPASLVSVTAVDTNANHAPTITSQPSFQAMVNVLYEYPVLAADPDGDALTYLLTQSPAGMTINPNTGLVRWTPTNTGPFYVQVEAADGRGAAFYQGYTLTVIAFTNLPPQFTSTPVTTTAPNAPYLYTATAVDPNRDSVTYALVQKPSNMAINAQSGAITWTPTASNLGGNPIAITANDGHGGVATQWFNLVVLYSGSGAPVVQPIPDQTVTEPATFTTLALDSYVVDPAYPDHQIIWSVTGAQQLTITIDTNRVATITYPTGTTTSERVTFLATNPDGQSAYAAPLLTVRGVDHAPVAALANLSDTETTRLETGFFELKGTADDADATDPVAYRVNLYDVEGKRLADVTPQPVNPAGWHEGRVPAGGSLGTLDLTQIRNGTYTLLLEVRGGAKAASATAEIALDCSLKIGQFTFSQQDLVIPVRGAGLRVIRTYDSLNTAAGDFGTSWTYSVSDLGMTINEQRSQTQDLFGNPFSLRTGGSWDVTLDMPDTGRRVTFKFNLDPGRLFKSRAYWSPPPGVYATLVPTCSPYLVTLTQALPPYWEASGIDTDWQNFDFPGFILTLKNGTQYRLERKDEGEHFIDGSGTAYGTFVHAYSGGHLARITEPTGDRTEFVRQNTLLKNIEQYDAANQKLKTVLFTRDSQKRVVAIYTPENMDANGNPSGPASVTYEYDSANNLVQVSKLTSAADPSHPVYAHTTFIYGHPRFPHFITEIKDPRGNSTLRSEYDAQGRLVATLDPFGNRTEIQHNTQARTETVYDRLGNATLHVYDERGNVVASTDPLGHTIRHTYDANNHLTSTTDPLGHVTSYTYDTKGNPTSITDPLGQVTRNIYDDQGNLISTTNPLGYTTTNIYDAAGRLVATIDAAGTREENEYNESGYLVATKNTLGQVMAQLVYDTAGNLAGISNSVGQMWHYEYDKNGRQTNAFYTWTNPANTNETLQVATQVQHNAAGLITRIAAPSGKPRQMAYDDFGQILTDEDAWGRQTQYVYDAAGRCIQTISSDGTQVLSVYDEENRRVIHTDKHLPGQSANAVHSAFDAAGKLIRTETLQNVIINVVTQQNGLVRSVLSSAGNSRSFTENTYDAAGRLIAQKNDKGQLTRRQYDAADRLIALWNALGQKTEFEYDAAGRQTLVRNAEGQETRFFYDPTGRLTRTIYPDGSSIRYQFDQLGHRVGETDQAGFSRRMEYDTEDRLTAVTLPEVLDPETGNRTQPRYEYSYDERGNLTSVRDPLGRITRYEYDFRNRLVARSLPEGQTERRTYDPLGRLQTLTDFNGQTTEIHYDPKGREAERKFYAAGATTAASSAKFEYDDFDRIKRLNHNQNVTEYSYDTDGHLIQVQSPEGTINYEFDPSHGLRTATRTAHSETRYGYDELNRLQSVTVHKRNGTLLSTPEVTTYAYDSTGSRSAMVLPNGLKTTYQYDPLNRLTNLAHLNSQDHPLTSYRYALTPHGRRSLATEIRWLSTTNSSTNNIHYAYDSNARLTNESYVASTGMAYSADYVYDLAGNRLKRNLKVGNQWLETTYSYDQNDRLLVESNFVSSSASGTRNTGQTRAALMQMQKRTHNTLLLLSALVFLPFFLPLLKRLSQARLDGLRAAAAVVKPGSLFRAGGSLNCFARSNAYLLAMIMAILPVYDQLLALESAQTLALTVNHWAPGNTVISYEYDANGSLLRKVTSGDENTTELYRYDEQKRLVEMTRSQETTAQTVLTSAAYTYNYDGARIKAVITRSINGTIESSYTNLYLTDPFNPTGYSQVLEETPAPGAKPTRSYTVGDDVIAQAGESPRDQAEYFLYDGHGSTRQLADYSGQITDTFDYDAYGVNLGPAPTAGLKSKTSLLYGGEAYDEALGQYYLRARYYNPQNGRFDQIDPYMGAKEDPLSLHKYVYALDDPVNHLDPSGQVTLFEVVGVVVIIMLVVKLFVLPAAHGGKTGGIRTKATVESIRSVYPGCPAWDEEEGDNTELALLIMHFAKWYRENETKMQHVDGPIRPADLVGACGWHAQTFNQYLADQKKNDPRVLKVFDTFFRGEGKTEMAGGGYQESHTFLIGWPRAATEALLNKSVYLKDQGVNFDSWKYHDLAPGYWSNAKTSYDVNDAWK